MNSKQRRARICAGMPNAVRRLATLKLMGDIEPAHAASLSRRLNLPRIRLSVFEATVREIVDVERTAKAREELKSLVTPLAMSMYSYSPLSSPSLGAGYSGRASNAVVIDEVTPFK